MADVDLRIQLERDPAEFEPGDPIRGTVHVSANEDTELRELYVRVFTLGTNTDRQELVTEPVGLRAGEELERCFELKAPAGPPSYSGQELGIEWNVMAHADVPGLRDPSAKAPITLLDTVVSAEERAAPAEPEGELRWVDLSDLSAAEAEAVRGMAEVEEYFPFRSSEARADLLARQSPRVRGCMKTCWGCIWAPGAIVAILVPMATGLQFIGDGRWGWGGFLVSLSLLVIGGLIAMYEHTTGGKLRRWLARKRYGVFALKADTEGLRRGGRVVWFVQMEPARRLRVSSARALLVLEERFSRRTHRTGSTRVRLRIDEQEFDLDEATTIEPGRDTLLAGNLRLPTSWPASYYGKGEMRWILRVDLELEDGPDWHQSAKLEVR